MNTELYANHIRSNIRRALKQAVEMQATLLRSQAVEDPFAATAITHRSRSACAQASAAAVPRSNPTDSTVGSLPKGRPANQQGLPPSPWHPEDASGLVALAEDSSATAIATAEEAAPSEIGTVRGYRYIKRNDAMRLGLSGELADSFDTEWFVDFEQSTEIRRGDHLRFGDGDTRRVCSVRGGVAKIYRICRLEAI